MVSPFVTKPRIICGAFIYTHGIQETKKGGYALFHFKCKKKQTTAVQIFFLKFLRELHNHKNVSAVNEYKVSLRGQYE